MKPTIVNVKSVQSDVKTKEEGGTRVRRLLTPKTAGVKHFYMGVAFMDPGEGHFWHVHDPQEEAYYILSGKATLYWEENGETKKTDVEEGDAVYTPRGLRNQLVNTGTKTLAIVYVQAPSKEV